MSKSAEEAALKAYPVQMTPLNYQDLIEEYGGKTEIDINTYARRLFLEGYEQAEKDLTFIAQFSSGPDGFFYGKGYQQAKKDLSWHPSTEHPPVDEEVIVLKDHLNLNCFYQIAFGHIVDKNTAIDYDGWNIDGVRYWMPMPEIPNEK